MSLTTDIIAGFPSETETEFEATVELMKAVRYDGAYTFKYSEREQTRARSMADDVPEAEKGRRVSELVRIQQEIAHERNRALIGAAEPVLVDGESRRSPDFFSGRTDTNKTVIFPRNGERPGDTVNVRIQRVNAATLFGERISGSAAQTREA